MQLRDVVSDLYSVPKRKVCIELWSPESGPEPVRLFLADQAETHGGPERPSDVLNGAEGFQAFEMADGRIALIPSSSIWLARVSSREEPDVEAEREADETSLRVRVDLEDGSSIQAEARYSLPEGRARLQDFLNGDARFLPLRDDAGVVLVNKRRIARVTPL